MSAIVEPVEAFDADRPVADLSLGRAHYGIYTYITLLVEVIGFAGGIRLALLIFGIGSDFGANQRFQLLDHDRHLGWPAAVD